MTAKYVNPGKVWDYLNSSGDTIKAGSLIEIAQDFAGIPDNDIPNGEVGGVTVDGLYAMPTSTTNIAVGSQGLSAAGALPMLAIKLATRQSACLGFYFKTVTQAANDPEPFLLNFQSHRGTEV